MHAGYCFLPLSTISSLGFSESFVAVMGVIRLSAGMSLNHEVKNADVKLSYRIASDGAYTLGLILVICQ